MSARIAVHSAEEKVHAETGEQHGDEYEEHGGFRKITVSEPRFQG